MLTRDDPIVDIDLLLSQIQYKQQTKDSYLVSILATYILHLVKRNMH